VKRSPSFGALLAAALIAGGGSSCPLPAGANAAQYAALVNGYRKAGSDFETRMSSLASFESSAASLNIWAKDATAKTNSYTVALTQIRQGINNEAFAAYPGNDTAAKCDRLSAELQGPHDSGFGFTQLSGDMEKVVGAALAVMNRLQSDENKLLSKIGEEKLNGRVDPADANLLSATQSALKSATASYNSLSELDNNVQATYVSIHSDFFSSCSGPQKTPSPTPPPKPVAASKSGCVGFNGYWANQVYGNNLLHIDGNSATLSTTTFTGTVNGKVMSGTFTNAKGDKGTFTFTMAYSDPDYIDVATKIGNSSQGLLTFHCVRGP